MHVLTLDPVIVTIIISTLLPAVTAFLTKENAHPTIKVVVSAILSLITAYVTSAVQANGSAIFTKQSFLLFVGSFITQQVSFHSIGVATNVNANVAPTVGIGPKAPEPAAFDDTANGEPPAPVATV